eukprot:09613.XXX_333894_334091_1 [CDS] Oithona nana genome sequencing.
MKLSKFVFRISSSEPSSLQKAQFDPLKQLLQSLLSLCLHCNVRMSSTIFRQFGHFSRFSNLSMFS